MQGNLAEFLNRFTSKSPHCLPSKLLAGLASKSLFTVLNSFRGHPNGLYLFNVAGAAAEISIKIFPNFLFGRFGIRVEQMFRGQYHARDKKTALYSPGFHKSFLERMGILDRA